MDVKVPIMKTAAKKVKNSKPIGWTCNSERGIKKFSDHELQNYNELFSLKDRSEIYPATTLNRLWIRLMLFCNDLSHKDAKDLDSDLTLLYSYIQVILEKNQRKVDERFYKYLENNNGTRYQLNISRPYKSIRFGGMFLYSILDFFRICEFESDEECQFDLNDFSRITERILQFTLNQKPFESK